MRSTFRICQNWDDIRELISYVKQTTIMSHDFETGTSDTSDKKGALKYYSEFSYPTIISIAFQPGSSWIIPLNHTESPFKDQWLRVLRYMGKNLIENPEITKVSWNTKFEYRWFKRYDIQMLGRCFDGMLAKHLLDEERPHGLKEMVAKFLPEFTGYGINSYGTASLQELSKYGGLDADLTLRLFLFFEGKLIRKGFYPLFRNLFTPLVFTLGNCEYQGIQVDREYLRELVLKYDLKIKAQDDLLRGIRKIARFNKKMIEEKKAQYLDQLEDEIEELKVEKRAHLIPSRKEKIKQVSLGNYLTKKERKLFEPINFGSPKQMAQLFYESPHGFKFPILERTESGAPSTSEDTIIKLKDQDKTGFIDGLLELRGLEKLQSTYIRGIWEVLPHNNMLHTSYLIHGTVTGRLSSQNPNMQNIPRITTNPDVKKMFVAPPGYLLVELDYSQAELRIVAELANEKKMIQWFKEAHNIHVAVAVAAEEVNMGKKLNYDDIYKITKDEKHPQYIEWTKKKKRAKTINFGILYGQGPPKLAETLKCSKEEAAKFLGEWLQTFPRIARWIKKQHQTVAKQGYVVNMWGMKRRLPNIYSSKFGERSEAQRQSVNTPIQGAASFFTLFSAIVIEEHRLKGTIPLDRPMVYTVHDSLGYYVRKENIHEFVKIAVPICANPQTQKYFNFQMKKVNMKASVELGPNWGSLHDYDSKKDYSL